MFTKITSGMFILVALMFIGCVPKGKKTSFNAHVAQREGRMEARMTEITLGLAKKVIAKQDKTIKTLEEMVRLLRINRILRKKYTKKLRRVIRELKRRQGKITL